MNPLGKSQVNKCSRRATIKHEMEGFTFGVYNGKHFIPVFALEDMVGHKLGEFSPTTKFIRHGGRMQKDMERGADTGALAQGAVAPASPGTAPEKPAATPARSKVSNGAKK